MGDVLNLYEVETSRDADDPPGYETPYSRIGPLVGASALGLSVYDLAAGQSVVGEVEDFLFAAAVGGGEVDPDDAGHDQRQGNHGSHHDGPLASWEWR